MRRPGDPDEDAGNRAVDYANDNVERVMAEMDLAELCKELDIGLAQGLEVFDAFHGWQGMYEFCQRVMSECSRWMIENHQGTTSSALSPLEDEGRLWEIFDEMLCAAIRANEGYQQRMVEKLQEKYLERDAEGWVDEDEEYEKLREREARP